MVTGKSISLGHLQPKTPKVTALTVAQLNLHAYFPRITGRSITGDSCGHRRCRIGHHTYEHTNTQRREMHLHPTIRVPRPREDREFRSYSSGGIGAAHLLDVALHGPGPAAAEIRRGVRHNRRQPTALLIAPRPTETRRASPPTPTACLQRPAPMGPDSSLGWSTTASGGEGRREHAGSRRGEGFGRGGSGWRAGEEGERSRGSGGGRGMERGVRKEGGGGVGGGGEGTGGVFFSSSTFSPRPFSPELLVLAC